MVRSNLVDDAAFRIAVAIGVLERLCHRLHDRFRRSVGVFVVRQLGEALVLLDGHAIAAASPALALAERRLDLRPQVWFRAEPQIPQSSRDSTHKASP